MARGVKKRPGGKARRVLVLMHEDLVPTNYQTLSKRERDARQTEYDVTRALRKLGHQVFMLGVRDELRPIREAIDKYSIDVVFMLLEEFRGEAIYDQNVVGYLELLGVPYTGCNPQGLVLARDKALAKQLLIYHRIRVPRFVVFPRGRKIRRPKRLGFPLIVKALDEDASMGISNASVVHDDGKLAERVRFIHERTQSNAIVEQFIKGKDVYVGVLGNDRLQVLPPQELVFSKKAAHGKLIATERAKYDEAYRKRWGIAVQPAGGLEHDAALNKMCKRIYRTLRLDGYARFDFRRDEKGRLWFLEANPNSDFARDGELAAAASSANIKYKQLVQKALGFALQRAHRD